MALGLQHHDAAGMRVLPEGSVSFGMTQREATMGNRVLPDIRYQARLRMNVTKDGMPSIELVTRRAVRASGSSPAETMAQAQPHPISSIHPGSAASASSSR